MADDEFDDETSDEDKDTEDDSDDEGDSDNGARKPTSSRSASSGSGWSMTNIVAIGVLIIGIVYFFGGSVASAVGGVAGYFGLILGLIILAGIGLMSFQTIRPNERGIVERFGKYKGFANAGLVMLVPFIDRLIKVNITEQMVEVDRQEIITKDALNASVEAQVYFKIKEDEASIKNTQYKVYNVSGQIVQLSRTTLRAIIGTMTLTDANSKRSALNKALTDQLQKETKAWGIEIVRAELKEVMPPKDVQETMNEVVKAEKTKIRNIDLAIAAQTEADGKKKAIIKLAEGDKQAAILKAEGEAEAIRLVNQSAQKHFKGNAILRQKLETAATILENNTKIIVPEGSNLVNAVGDIAGVVPVPKK